MYTTTSTALVARSTKFYFLLTFLIFAISSFSTTVYSQSVSVTNTTINPVCAGNSITVNFQTINGQGNPRRYKTTSVLQVYLQASATTAAISLGTITGLSYPNNGNGDANNFSGNFTIPVGSIGATTYRIYINSTTPNYIGSAYATNASPSFTVSEPAIAGTILGGTTLCSTTNSTILTLSGFSGASRQWQSSLNGTTFTDIIGQTGTTLTVANLAITTHYRATIGNGACPTVYTPTTSIQVNTSIGGISAPSQTICSGSAASPITVSGYVGTIIKWQTANSALFLSPIDIVSTSNILSAALIGTPATPTYFRAVIQNGSCPIAYSTPARVELGQTATWNGTAWSPSAPTSVMTAVIAGNYSQDANIDACSLTVTNNSVVTIPSGYDVTLYGALTVDAGSIFTIENNANLLQVSNAANTGNIVVKRNSSMLKRLDYTLWSSPVAGQNLLAFSPLTTVTPTSRFYQYNIQTNLFANILNPASVGFTVGKGYMIRMPNNHPTTPTIWNGSFTGVPTNGTLTLPLENYAVNKRLNLVGNPYPSPISAVAFALENVTQITGALYFWRKTNGNESPTYCSWTKAGSSGTFVSNNQSQVQNPNNVIQTGQAFFVEASTTGSSITFTNSMRVGNHDNQFFKSSPIVNARTEQEAHRLWLNISNSDDAFCQTAIGYYEEATQGIDEGLDGKFVNDGVTEIYSVLDAEKLVIQARSLPFEATDIVPLGFKAAASGTYTIALDHVDGLFAEGQTIYLRDLLTGNSTDITAAGYSFETAEGIFNERFEIAYQQQLGVHDNDLATEAVTIYKNDRTFVIDAGVAMIAQVQVYDIRGALLQQIDAVNASEARFVSDTTNQVLIVKVTTNNNGLIVKKVIN